MIGIELEQQDDAIVELFNPAYDIDNKTLKYDVTSDNSTSIDFPSEFGQITLVIDEIINACAWTGNC